MADDIERTFSESELTAIVADRVVRETAEVVAERDQLKTEHAELQAKLDVEISRAEAAELKATQAEKELADFKAEIEEARERAARADERITKVREAAAHLGDDFFDEERTARIVAMSDEMFAGYVSDLGLTAAGASAAGTTSTPRETAMSGAPGGHGKTGSAAAAFFGFTPNPVKEG